jgi:hypothetical protein
MKRISVIATLAGLLALGGAGIANAASIGVYVGDGHARWHHGHHWRNAYAYSPECRVVVKYHVNRRGERVKVKHRICD